MRKLFLFLALSLVTTLVPAKNDPTDIGSFVNDFGFIRLKADSEGCQKGEPKLRRVEAGHVNHGPLQGCYFIAHEVVYVLWSDGSVDAFRTHRFNMRSL